MDNDRPLTRPYKLVPMFPVTSYVPESKCPHRVKLRNGTVFCCMVCMKSGKDHLPGMQVRDADRSALKVWRPEGGRDQWSVDEHADPTRYVAPTAPAKEPTRREKRAANKAATTA